MQHQHAKTCHRESKPRNQPPIRHEPADDDDERQLDDFAGLNGDAADIEPVFRAVRLLADEQREDEQHEREQHHRPYEQPEVAPDADEVDAHDHRRQPDEIVDGLVVGIRRVGVVEDEQPQRAQEVGQRQQQLIHREEPRQEASRERARQRYGDGECERLPLAIAQEQKAECADVENRNRPRQRAAGVFQLFTPALAVTRQGNHLAKIEIGAFWRENLITIERYCAESVL